MSFECALQYKGEANVLAHLEAHARATGEVPEELERLSAGPPAGTESLWTAFLVLHASRGSNGFSRSPISLSNILAYATLYQIQFTAWEIDVLIELDSELLKLLAKKEVK